MRPAVSFALCLLGIVLVQAVPANIKDKSLIEEAEAASNINLEDAGSEKDRAKKSAASFCVEIRPGANNEGTQQAQSAQMVVAPQPLSIVQPAVQQVVQPASQQTFSIVPASQPVQQTSSNIVLSSQQPAQPVHTLHIMQPASQPCVQPATYSIVQNQPAPQPTATLNIVRPQPAPQPTATLNIVQPAPKPEPKPLPEPVAVPEPQEKFERIVEVVKPEPEHQKPTQVVNIIQPAHSQPIQEHTETVNMMPMEPACEEKVVMVPKPIMIMPEPEPKPLAAYVEVPTMTQQCHHHALRTECTCRPKSLHSSALNERSMYPIAMSPSLRAHHRLEPMMFAGQSRTPTFLLNRSIRSDKEANNETAE